MTLLDYLRQADPQQSALVTENSRLSFKALVLWAEELRASLRANKGIRLFVNTADPVDAVITFAALDGVADAIILSSPSLDAETIQILAQYAEADAVLSERQDIQDGPPIIHRSADLTKIPASKSFSGETKWIMTTSGTTGQPKLVPHSLKSLTRTTKSDQNRGRSQVWGLLYDYTRFAGLQVILQSLLSGASLIIPSESLSLNDRISFLAKARVTHLSATPTFWRKILMSSASQDLPLRQITLGGEIADDAILSALKRSYPEARISHIFASTEAGVGFSVTDGRRGFPLTFLDEPPQGIALRIEEEQLFIRNEYAASSYLGQKDTIAQDGWVNTGDQVHITNDRVLFLGRSNGVINVGGNKVHPEEVEATILLYPGIEMVRVYAKKNPITGALVAVDILPKQDVTDHAGLRDALKAWLPNQLERYKVPAFIRIVETLEINSAGKLKRNL